MRDCALRGAALDEVPARRRSERTVVNNIVERRKRTMGIKIRRELKWFVGGD
jgi:hypothetical protein